MEQQQTQENQDRKLFCEVNGEGTPTDLLCTYLAGNALPTLLTNITKTIQFRELFYLLS
jgi:hypothetical protein